MASQVVIDFKSIGEQIVAGIMGSIDKVRSDIAPRTISRPRSSRSVRWTSVSRFSCLSSEQELHNWCCTTDDPSDGARRGRRGKAISARILRQRFDNLSNVRNHQPDIIFMSSMETDTVEKALRMLLELTMAMLNKRADHQMFGEGEWVEQASGGYYAPTSTSI
ncbi:hypothetical protein LTR56_025200 [Elasticomyces elasticus]|nr:hypothetical protein LTR56_025200 [Elasticomyces elasticus]KAK3649265.1 hypothetical protein LTR22_012994 [Elasticomyces elasticus]KAK4928201.1 hypothetical protein LTR49_005139 [Elasticomyces elasticus]KAK5765955.1 hypothetical protein LTS12_003962 [Elasticomyces elasticus]